MPMTLRRFTANLSCCCSCEPSVDLDGEVDLYHFQMLRSIGRGAYGKVRVVEHKKTGGLYALKYVDKAKCLKSKAAANIVQERMLLEEIDHPFVVNLRYAFQDDEYCFLVLDLMLGGDLRFHCLRRGSLGEAAVRFYVAEISSALSYLHQNGICHRDVKPDNILLDLHGHAHLTDFNVAIHFSEKKFHSAIAGTMVYMAPEVVSRIGYSWQIDYWSLGVTAFECLFHGKRPFAAKSKNAEVVRRSINQDDLVFPQGADEICSPEGMAALTALLKRNSGERLGCKGWSRRRGQEQLRSHPWFKDVDWEKLDTRQLTPPFIPDDKSLNFDNHELDDIFSHSRPLGYRRRRVEQDLEKMTPERRHLQESFTLYDFQKMPRKSYYPYNEPIVAPDPPASHRASLVTRIGTPAPAVTPQISTDESHATE